MARKLVLFITAGFFHIASASAQAMDNTLSFRNIPAGNYFRISYENDFFTASDRDYTQGILIEKVHPAFSRFFLMKILWHPQHSEIKYGLAIEHNAYTPNQIDQYAIQYGDRPYAGVLLLKSFLIAQNYERRIRTSVSFSAGILGQGAGGEQIQRTIHHWIHYTQPQGWHNQIHNMPALNYQINGEKEICQYGNYFLISAFGSARLGTLSDKISAGFTTRLGNIQSAFSRPDIIKRTFQWYVYFHISGSAVGYDATLQGGILNHTDVYSIDAADIERLTVQNQFGIVLIFRSLYLEYFRTGTTAEFETGIYHRTGGLQIGFGF